MGSIAGPDAQSALIATRRLDSHLRQQEDEQFLGSLWRYFAEPKNQVARKSRDYVRWVQRSLNKIMGLRLVVDGISGRNTRSAIRKFQRQQRLTADGIVGSRTERALIAAGSDPPPRAAGSQPTSKAPGATRPLALVNIRMPKSGPGFTTSNNNYKYGVPETIEALKAIAREWRKRRPDVQFMVRDISRQGGGKFSTHKSHRIGLDADVQLWVGRQKVSSTHSNYAKWRHYIEELALIIRRNPALPVKRVWFQDKARRTKNVDHTDSGHTRHLHIRFCMPANYGSQLDLNRVYKPGERKPSYTCKSQAKSGTGACNKVKRLKIGKTTLWSLAGESAIFFKAGMAIDADGAPRAYHPDRKKGLDFLGNAGRPGNWWGIATDNHRKDGNPIVQGPDNPAPGFYISTTALVDGTRKRSDSRRYVDSTKIPYIALPKQVMRHLRIRKGDFAVAFNGKNRKFSYAIFADVGPAGKVGEGSIALSKALGNDPFVRGKARRGIPGDVIYIVFPRSGNRKPRSIEVINREGARLFKAWGGIAQTLYRTHFRMVNRPGYRPMIDEFILRHISPHILSKLTVTVYSSQASVFQVKMCSFFSQYQEMAHRAFLHLCLRRLQIIVQVCQALSSIKNVAWWTRAISARGLRFL